MAPIMGPVISGLFGGIAGPQPAEAPASAPATTPAPAPQPDQNDQGQALGGLNLGGQSLNLNIGGKGSPRPKVPVKGGKR